MNTIIYKKRERFDRGKLNSFQDLPSDVQEKFTTIKKEINKDNPNTKCYVMGSYYWGFWDENSDYDLNVNRPIKNLESIKSRLNEIKFDVLNVNLFREIEIP